MASRALAAAARSPDDYAEVYDRILAPGERAGDHPLARRDVRSGARGLLGRRATITRRWTSCLDVIAANAAKVDGIKISLLDKDKEIAMRRRLPAGVRMYTGDDFNYAELIAGDDAGLFRRAARHLRRDRAGGVRGARRARPAAMRATFHDILAPTVPLSRHIFRAPTRFYKTGVVFMAWLNGHQDHFVMVGGQQSARSILHLAELFRLADAAGLLADPELAAARMRAGHGDPRRRGLMRDLSADRALLSLNTATRRSNGRSSR